MCFPYFDRDKLPQDGIGVGWSGGCICWSGRPTLLRQAQHAPNSLPVREGGCHRTRATAPPKVPPVGSDRYSIKHASDGSKEVEYLTDASSEAKRPKLILLDLKLPKYDGFAILERIRNVSGWTKVPVVVLSSSSIESDVSRSYELGANAYVVKPIRYDA